MFGNKLKCGASELVQLLICQLYFVLNILSFFYRQIAKIYGFFKPITLEIDKLSDFVAVAVRAMTLIKGGRILRISPIRCNNCLKVSPLENNKTQAS